MIYLGTMKDFKPKEYDEIWFIMRSMKWLKSADLLLSYPNVHHVPNLSPSHDLFSWYLLQKKDDNWNKDTFNRRYVPVFLEQMHDDEARRDLNLLYYKSKAGKKILLICSCVDELMCHRSIVGGLMIGVGSDVYSISNPNCCEYIKYYDLYKQGYLNLNNMQSTYEKRMSHIREDLLPDIDIDLK